MEKEIEKKFDVPLTSSTLILMAQLSDHAKYQGFTVSPPKFVERSFEYYDSSDLGILRNGETLRRVGGFDPEKDKGMFRYDFKIGPVDDRYEANYWTNETLKPEEILERFDLRKFYTRIFPSASAMTQHRKVKLQKGETLIELTLDLFNVFLGEPFQELEMELERGNPHNVVSLTRFAEEQLRLERISTQKYKRVMESKKINPYT